MAIPVLELMIRGIAAGAFVLLALCIGLAGRAPARLAGTLFCLAAAAHTFTQSQPAFDALGLVAPPVWILSVAGAGLLWAFALELFGDNVRLSPWRWIRVRDDLHPGRARRRLPWQLASAGQPERL